MREKKLKYKIIHLKDKQKCNYFIKDKVLSFRCEKIKRFSSQSGAIFLTQNYNLKEKHFDIEGGKCE